VIGPIGEADWPASRGGSYGRPGKEGRAVIRIAIGMLLGAAIAAAAQVNTLTQILVPGHTIRITCGLNLPGLPSPPTRIETAPVAGATVPSIDVHCLSRG